jgi:exonuclease SbcD
MFKKSLGLFSYVHFSLAHLDINHQMKVLHTSDWHLGRTLYGRRCTYEFQLFLNWLVDEIENQKADCLIVAGDVFDSTTPSNIAQTQYYSFLYGVSNTCCRHVIIIGGNHDSPSLLNAPRQLLQQLNVSIIGNKTETPDDEVIVLYDRDSNAEAIVCAVPYLRDRDVRSSESYESIDDKARKLIEGIHQHYLDVVEIAEQKRKKLSGNIPIIATGHLFAAGGRVAENNEVRDLYVGTLAHVPSSFFPDSIDYLALGHLHIAQQVNSSPTRRYCGSPLQLSFGRNNSQKSITAVTFSSDISVEIIAVPRFLRLETVSGTTPEIITAIENLLTESGPILLEVYYTGQDISLLRDMLAEKTHGSKLEVIRIINSRTAGVKMQQDTSSQSLEDLDEFDVFRKCLDAHDVDENEREELEYCFSKILELIGEENDNEEIP